MGNHIDDEEVLKDEALTVLVSGCMHLKNKVSNLIIVSVRRPFLTQIRRLIKRQLRPVILCFGRVNHEQTSIAISTISRWHSESRIRKMGNGTSKQLVQQKEEMLWMQMGTKLGRLGYDIELEKLLPTVNSEDLVTIISSQKTRKNLRILSQR